MPHRSHRLSMLLIAATSVGSVAAVGVLLNALAHHRAARRELGA